MDENKIKEAREHYLTSGYGRFDLLAEIVPQETLLKKPRIVLRYLYKTFELSPQQISYPAFTAWLRRYRQGLHHMTNNKKKETPPAGSNIQAQDDFEFKPTDPNSNSKQEETIIKIL